MDFVERSFGIVNVVVYETLRIENVKYFNCAIIDPIFKRANQVLDDIHLK